MSAEAATAARAFSSEAERIGEPIVFIRGEAVARAARERSEQERV